MNKSKVRQAALNLIYAIEQNGGDTRSFDFDLFWRLTQEKETDHYRRALAKAIAHVCRASNLTAELMETRTATVLNTVHKDMSARRLYEAVDRLQKRSDEFEKSVATMKYCLQDKRQTTTDMLAQRCKEVITLAVAVNGLGKELLPVFADFPAYRGILDPLAAVIQRRGKLLEACAALASPLTLENQNEFAGLANHARNLQELRPEAEPLACNIIAKKAELDSRLTGLLHHYSLKRLDTVDRCILYIALYELDVNKLDVPIAISEANALADAYSGNKSAPFIHGILSAAVQPSTLPADPE